MRTVQFISTKAAARLHSNLLEIQQLGSVDKVYFDPDGYGISVIPRYIERLDKAIRDAQLLNMTTSTQDFMVPFDYANDGYMIIKVLNEFQKTRRAPEPVAAPVFALKAQYDVNEAKALRKDNSAAAWDIAREAMYNASKNR